MNNKNVNKVNFNVKVERDIKDRFIKVCENNDTKASQEIRKFMRDYLQKHSQMSMNFS